MMAKVNAMDLSSTSEPEREALAHEEDGGSDLAVRAQRFEPEALAQMHDRYFDRIYSFVYARVGNHVEAEEVTGQVFLRALDALPRFRGGSELLGPWLYKLAHEVLTTRHANTAGGDAPEANGDGGDARLQGVRAAIAELPEPQQAIVMLRLVAGLDAAQIAAVTGRRVGAVQAIQRRALKNLRSIMGRRGLL